MESVARVFKITLPAYLKSLPVPTTFYGFLNLTGEQWIRLLPFMLTVGIILYAVTRLLLPEGLRWKKADVAINPIIKKDNPKVVDLVDIEDIDKEKVSYCRCWRSSKFPLCDGSHNKHNEESGDNVGPLVLKKAKAAAK